jgi:hypothetical protein
MARARNRRSRLNFLLWDYLRWPVGFLWCLLFLPGHAQDTAAPLSADPVCGFIAGPHFYYEADAVREGLAVTLSAGEVRAGEPVTLRFFVQQRPRGFPVDKLQIEHEKFMHVIGARDDLSDFFHLHPTRVGAGVWEAPHTFTHGGRYKLWCDVKYHGTSYSFGQALVTVTGNLGETGKPVPAMCAVVSGYSIRLKCAEPLVAGGTNLLKFLIQDAAGSSPELENFLGTPMHLVIIRQDLAIYLHAHPEGRRPGESAVSFKQIFPEPGAYTLFAQFRPKERGLPSGEALLVEFRVLVADQGGKAGKAAN